MVANLRLQPCYARNVEIFFKHIKKNSSIDKITSHKIETVNNIIISSSINQLIIDRLISIYNNCNIKKNKCINITTFYDIYSKHLMYKLINNNLSFEEFDSLSLRQQSCYARKNNNFKYFVLYTKNR